MERKKNWKIKNESTSEMPSMYSTSIRRDESKKIFHFLPFLIKNVAACRVFFSVPFRNTHMIY